MRCPSNVGCSFRVALSIELRFKGLSTDETFADLGVPLLRSVLPPVLPFKPVSLVPDELLSAFNSHVVVFGQDSGCVVFKAFLLVDFLVISGWLLGVCRSVLSFFTSFFTKSSVSVEVFLVPLVFRRDSGCNVFKRFFPSDSAAVLWTLSGWRSVLFPPVLSVLLLVLHGEDPWDFLGAFSDDCGVCFNWSFLDRRPKWLASLTLPVLVELFCASLVFGLTSLTSTCPHVTLLFPFFPRCGTFSFTFFERFSVPLHSFTDSSKRGAPLLAFPEVVRWLRISLSLVRRSVFAMADEDPLLLPPKLSNNRDLSMVNVWCPSLEECRLAGWSCLSTAVATVLSSNSLLLEELGPPFCVSTIFTKASASESEEDSSPSSFSVSLSFSVSNVSLLLAFGVSTLSSLRAFLAFNVFSSSVSRDLASVMSSLLELISPSPFSTSLALSLVTKTVFCSGSSFRNLVSSVAMTLRQSPHVPWPEGLSSLVKISDEFAWFLNNSLVGSFLALFSFPGTLSELLKADSIEPSEDTVTLSLSPEASKALILCEALSRIIPKLTDTSEASVVFE